MAARRSGFGLYNSMPWGTHREVVEAQTVFHIPVTCFDMHVLICFGLNLCLLIYLAELSYSSVPMDLSW